MSRCVVIPEKIVRQVLKEHKQKTGNDFTCCVWLRDSELGCYLRDFNRHTELDYQASYMLLRQLLVPLGYDIDGCDAIYYTTSQLFIVVWNEDE